MWVILKQAKQTRDKNEYGGWKKPITPKVKKQLRGNEIRFKKEIEPIKDRIIRDDTNLF